MLDSHTYNRRSLFARGPSALQPPYRYETGFAAVRLHRQKQRSACQRTYVSKSRATARKPRGSPGSAPALNLLPAGNAPCLPGLLPSGLLQSQGPHHDVVVGQLLRRSRRCGPVTCRRLVGPGSRRPPATPAISASFWLWWWATTTASPWPARTSRRGRWRWRCRTTSSTFSNCASTAAEVIDGPAGCTQARLVRLDLV